VRRTVGPRCTICNHPARPQIDLAIATGLSKRAVAARFVASRHAVWRHAQAHLTAEMRAALATKLLQREGDTRRILLEEDAGVTEALKAIRGPLFGLYLTAVDTGDSKAAAALFGRLHENLAFVGKLTGSSCPMPAPPLPTFCCRPIFSGCARSSSACSRAIPRHGRKSLPFSVRRGCRRPPRWGRRQKRSSKRCPSRPSMTIDLGLDLAHALDPVAFVQDRLKFEPDPWQARLLHSSAPWILLNCCRQSGKSTTTAAVALHTALYDPGLILLVSPSLRQSKELFAKVTGFLKDLEPAEVLEEDNKSCCALANGARLVSLPGDPNTLRGYSAPKLIIKDEAAFVSDAMQAALDPMLAVSKGRLIARTSFWRCWSASTVLA